MLTGQGSGLPDQTGTMPQVMALFILSLLPFFSGFFFSQPFLPHHISHEFACRAFFYNLTLLWNNC